MPTITVSVDGSTASVQLTVQTPASPVVEFNRVDYTAQSLPEPTGRYSIIDTQYATASGPTKAIVDQIKAGDPSCRVLCYFATDVFDPANSNGITMVPASVASSMVPASAIKDSTGRVVTKPYGSSSLTCMDLTSAAWQQAVARQVAQHVIAGDFDGAYFDGMGLTAAEQGLGSVSQPASPVIRSPSSLQAGWVSMANAVRKQLPAGKLLFGNIAGAGAASSGGPAGLASVVAAFDGWEEEMFAVQFTGVPQPLAVWQQQLANVQWSESQGKLCMLNCDAHGNLGLAQFALCSALLVMAGRTSWCTDLGVYGEQEHWQQIDQQAQQLGPPVDVSYTVTAGKYSRRFQNGTVTVDPVAHTGSIN